MALSELEFFGTPFQTELTKVALDDAVGHVEIPEGATNPVQKRWPVLWQTNLALHHLNDQVINGLIRADSIPAHPPGDSPR